MKVKSSFRIISLALMVMFVVAMVAGCGSSSTTPAAGTPAAAADTAVKADTAKADTAKADAPKSDKKRKVVFQVMGTGSPYPAAMASNFKKLGEAEGWEVVIMDGKLDPVTNVKCLEEAIAMKPDVITSNPIDSAACSQAYKKAYEAGIPLMLETINCLKEDEKFTVGYTGPNDYAHGVSAAEIFHEALKGKGNIIMETTAPGQDTTFRRKGGCEDRLKELKSEIKVIGVMNTDCKKELAIKVTEDFITKFGDKINGVYAFEDYSAMGASIAFRDAGMDVSKIIIHGVGGSIEGLQGIKDGLIYSTTLQSPSRSMVQSVKLCKEIMDKGIKPPQQLPSYFNYIQIPKITKANVEEFMPGDW